MTKTKPAVKLDKTTQKLQNMERRLRDILEQFDTETIVNHLIAEAEEGIFQLEMEIENEQSELKAGFDKAYVASVKEGVKLMRADIRIRKKLISELRNKVRKLYSSLKYPY